MSLCQAASQAPLKGSGTLFRSILTQTKVECHSVLAVLAVLAVLSVSQKENKMFKYGETCVFFKSLVLCLFLCPPLQLIAVVQEST